MPDRSKDTSGSPTSSVELNAVISIMDSLREQIRGYQEALRIVVGLREEIKNNPDLQNKVKTPDGLVEVLKTKGVPEVYARSFTVEEYKTEAPSDMASDAAFGDITGTCCCTRCCLTF